MQLKLQVLLVLLMFRHAVNFYSESRERLQTLQTLKSQGWSEHAKTRKHSAEHLRVVDYSLIVAEE